MLKNILTLWSRYISFIIILYTVTGVLKCWILKGICEILLQSNNLEIFYSVISIILSAAYTSLLERQLVGVLQQRLGPSLVGGFGALLQPIADGFKLILKELIIPSKSKLLIYLFAPLYTFIITITIWALIPLSSNPYFIFNNNSYNLLIVLALLILGSYGPIFGGWASNNKYALLGSYRSIALSGSYGITIGMVFIIPITYAQSFNILTIVAHQKYYWFIFPSLEGNIFFWIVMLTEIKKVPFDVSESEAELSSGYLIEYSGFNFALFIISEYASILLLISVFILCFLGGWLPLNNSINLYLNVFLFLVFPWWDCFAVLSEPATFSFKQGFVLIFYFIIRTVLPNYRFDYIMALHWKYLFPLLLSLVITNIFLI